MENINELTRRVKMLYNVSFSGQENGKTCKFEISRDVRTFLAPEEDGKLREISHIKITISIDNDIVDEKYIEIQEMGDLLKEYRSKYEYYENKRLTKAIIRKKYPKIVTRLLRSFAESSVFFDYAGGYTNDCSGNYGFWKPGHFINYVIHSFEKNCYNSLLSEHTDAKDKQHTMYFLKETYDKNNSDILSLYDMGLLHKVDVEIEDGVLSGEFSNYYVPFDVQGNTEIQTPAVKATWESIVQDMRECIKIIHGTQKRFVDDKQKEWNTKLRNK